jgi:hypothetical protein
MLDAAALLTRDELEALTGRRQVAAMVKWLHRHNWVYEAPDRRGDIPKVARSFFNAKMTGTPLPHANRREAPRVDFFTTRPA